MNNEYVCYAVDNKIKMKENFEDDDDEFKINQQEELKIYQEEQKHKEYNIKNEELIKNAILATSKLQKELDSCNDNLCKHNAKINLRNGILIYIKNNLTEIDDDFNLQLGEYLKSHLSDIFTEFSIPLNFKVLELYPNVKEIINLVPNKAVSLDQKNALKYSESLVNNAYSFAFAIAPIVIEDEIVCIEDSQICISAVNAYFKENHKKLINLVIQFIQENIIPSIDDYVKTQIKFFLKKNGLGLFSDCNVDFVFPLIFKSPYNSIVDQTSLIVAKATLEKKFLSSESYQLRYNILVGIIIILILVIIYMYYRLMFK